MGSSDPNRYRTNWQLVAFIVIFLIAYAWMKLGRGYRDAARDQQSKEWMNRERAK
jgi:hypothetical protein